MLSLRSVARVRRFFSTSQTPGGIQSFKETIKGYMGLSNLSTNPDQQAEPPPVNYSQIVKDIQSDSYDNTQVQQHLQEIYASIRKVIDESYEHKLIPRLLNSVPPKELCLAAIEQFIGSMTQPRNEKIMNLLLEYAEANTKTEEEKYEVQYYKLYLEKLQAVQSGSREMFERCNEQLIDLCQKNVPNAMHIIAKEVYKLALNITNSKDKKQKREMMNQAAELFIGAMEKGNWNSLYYIGDMAENGDLPGGVDLKYAYECYLVSASLDNPKAYFKLAKMHKEGVITEKSAELQYFYTKRAAELGLAEAQHNLGCIYIDKSSQKYDSLKALAWFMHADSQKFIHSTFNLAKLFMEGGQDGKVKVNYEAAIMYLEKVSKEGQLNVDKLVQRCLNLIEQQAAERRREQQSADDIRAQKL